MIMIDINSGVQRRMLEPIAAQIISERLIRKIWKPIRFLQNDKNRGFMFIALRFEL